VLVPDSGFGDFAKAITEVLASQTQAES